MNEIAVHQSNVSVDTGSAQSASALNGFGGYELFGLGWSPETSSGDYVGRHRSADA